MVNLNMCIKLKVYRIFRTQVPVESGVTVSIRDVHNLSSCRHIASYAFCDGKPTNSDNILAAKFCSNSCYGWTARLVDILT